MSTALCCSTAAAAAAATATATATTTTTTTTTTILTLISDSSSSSRRRTDRGAISDVKVADVTMMMLLRCTVCSRFSGFHLLLLIVKATFIIIIIISHRYDVRKHSFNEITWCCVVLAYTVSTRHGTCHCLTLLHHCHHHHHHQQDLAMTFVILDTLNIFDWLIEQQQQQQQQHWLEWILKITY